MNEFWLAGCVFSLFKRGAVVEGVSRYQAKYEPTKHQRAEGKNRVADHTQPAQSSEQWSLQELRRARLPRAILHRGPGLHESNR